MDPAAAQAIALAEGEKDAAILATAGLIAFTAPRGAGSLAGADFTELVDAGQGNRAHLYLLCGDNDVTRPRRQCGRLAPYSRRTTTLTPLILQGRRKAARWRTLQGRRKAARWRTLAGGPSRR